MNINWDDDSQYMEKYGKIKVMFPVTTIQQRDFVASFGDLLELVPQLDTTGGQRVHQDLLKIRAHGLVDAEQWEKKHLQQLNPYIKSCMYNMYIYIT